MSVKIGTAFDPSMFTVFFLLKKSYITSKGYTLGEIIIPCLLSVCFDDAMHVIYASYFVNIGFRVNFSGIYV